jgi:hypothetical protein
MSESPIYSVTLDDISKSISDVQGSIAEQRKFMAEHLKMTNLLAKNDLARNKTLKETSNHWKTIKNSMKESYALTMRMAKTGVGLGVGLGVAAIGGGYGMAQLSGSAATDRDRAKGVGATIGELNAVAKSFKRFFDNADAELSKVSQAKADQTSLNGLSGLSLLLNKTREEVAKMREADIVAESVPAIKRKYEEIKAAGEESLLGQEGYKQSKGLGNYSLSDIKRIGSTSWEEVNTQYGKYKENTKDFNLSDPEARKHEDFADQVDASWKKITTSFQTALVPLLPNLESLSKEVSGMAAAVVKSGAAHDVIKKAADGLGDVLKYMGSQEARDDAKAVQKAIHDISGALSDFSENPIDFLINGRKNKEDQNQASNQSDNKRAGLGTAAIKIGGAAIGGFAEGIGGGIHAPTNKDITANDYFRDLKRHAGKVGEWATTPLWGKGSKKIDGLTPEQTAALMKDVRRTESDGGGGYLAGDKKGHSYIGAYQFGAGALESVGLLKKGAGKRKKAYLDKENWNNGLDYEQFLANKELQDNAFVQLSNQTVDYAKKRSVITQGTPAEKVAGMVKAGHIAGAGGAVALAKAGIDSKDGNGTKTSKYYNDGVNAIRGTKSVNVRNVISVDVKTRPGADITAQAQGLNS